jgi:cbb3-type cytochrome oxidase maturation protein
MNIIFVLIPLGLILVAFAVWAFFWATGSGQFDDLDGPAWKILLDDDRRPPGTTTEKDDDQPDGAPDER